MQNVIITSSFTTGPKTQCALYEYAALKQAKS